MTKHCSCENNFCEARQEELSPRYFQYCQGTSGLPREKELWYLARLDGEASPPNIFQKAKNFAVAVAQQAATGFKEVDDAEYQRRLDICKDCPFVKKEGETLLCNKCGCKMSGTLLAKARWASQKCPIDKWS